MLKHSTFKYVFLFLLFNFINFKNITKYLYEQMHLLFFTDLSDKYNYICYSFSYNITNKVTATITLPKKLTVFDFIKALVIRIIVPINEKKLLFFIIANPLQDIENISKNLKTTILDIQLRLNNLYKIFGVDNYSNLIFLLLSKEYYYKPSSRLTYSENKIIELLFYGVPKNIIYSSLNITKTTLATHIRNIYRKLEVNSKNSAVLSILQEHGILKRPEEFYTDMKNVNIQVK
jgi:DNA-binding CsgD family transcriptional regulator